MKKLLSIVFGLLLLFMVSIATVIAIIDPNDFKPLIADEFKKATGRELVIEGEINWQFWPSLGISIDKLAVNNPPGFAESTMLSLQRVAMSVAVMPLLSDKIEVGVITLYGARVFVQTLADGRSNLDGLVASSTNGPVEPPSTSATDATASADNSASTVIESTAKKEWVIAIGGLDVLNASASIRDDKTGVINQITALNLNVGKLATGLWVPMTFDIKGQQNENAFALKGAAEAMFSKNMKKSQLREVRLVAAVKGNEFTLDKATVNMDRFGLGLPAVIDVAIKGKANALGVDAKINATVLVDETITEIAATEIALQASLSDPSLPKQKMTLGFKGNALIDTQQKSILLSELAMNADELMVNGSASVTLADIPAIRFDLHSDLIDLDKFFGTQTAPVTATATAPATVPVATSPTEIKNNPENAAVTVAPLSDVEPNLSALKTIDVAGKISITQFIASNIHITDVLADVAINRGKVNLHQFDAKLYGGTIDVDFSLDSTVSPPRYQVNKEIKNVDIQALLMAAAAQDKLSATGNINANVRGVGLSEKALRSGITGTFAVNFADGSIAGINIPEMIREAKATLKGKRAEYVEEIKKTDFSALTATFNLGQGNAATKNIKLDAPGIRVHGEGVSNLLTQTVDFDILTSLVGSSKGQGGKDINELNDLTIPIIIGGTWNDPTYKLDLKSLLSSNKVLEEKIRNEAERGLKKIIGDKADNEKIKQITNKLFNSLFN